MDNLTDALSLFGGNCTACFKLNETISTSHLETQRREKLRILITPLIEESI